MIRRPSQVAALGVLAGLTIVLQLGPVFWPGGGLLLSALATLPAGIASALAPRRCTWFYFAVCFLLGLAAPGEMFIYLTMTGPLGLMLGLTMRRPAWQSILAAGAALSAGMLVLEPLAGIRPFGGAEAGLEPVALVSAYLVFALLYAALWHYLIRRLLLRLPFSPLNGLYWGK